MTPLFVFIVIFMSTFVQSVSGFGLALVSMAFLPALIGIHAAAPLVALYAILIEVVLLIRFHQELSLREIWKVVVASIIGVPFGVILLRYVSERIALSVLGILLIAYAVYALMGKRLPKSDHFALPWLAGFLGGLLGGAYNTSGPPVILYADTQDWSPERFKSNLQGYFIVNSTQVVIGHYFAGNYGQDVLTWLPYTIPAVILGLLIGALLDKHIPPLVFRKIVLVMLIVMGLVNLIT
ncbi:MAG: sulfite exporter TauE/SafE family protein [Anaerolineales bacterium]|nr:sulfite exporter TauE/SafE family protein [Anaerolineales bacterium]